MKLPSARILIFAAFVFPAVAQARVFSLGKSRFASYLTFSYGPSKINDGPYVNESTAASWGDGVKTNTGGEFGFVYATPFVNWRFGLEILKPAAVGGITAKNAAGTTVYEIKTDVQGVIPKIGMEINLYRGPWYRFLLFAAAGSGSVDVTNDYSSVTIAPNAAFTAKYKGSGTATSGGLSFEMAAFDTTAMVLELGYRQMFVNNLKYTEAVTGFGGAQVSGDAANWTDGQARELQFSGAYAAFGFRFWLF